MLDLNVASSRFKSGRNWILGLFFSCKSDDTLMNRKNIRFKLGIGAKLLGYRQTAVWVWENDGGKGFLSLLAFVFVLAGITTCP